MAWVDKNFPRTYAVSLVSTASLKRTKEKHSHQVRMAKRPPKSPESTILWFSQITVLCRTTEIFDEFFFNGFSYEARNSRIFKNTCITLSKTHIQVLKSTVCIVWNIDFGKKRALFLFYCKM
uniref:Uncharacterized protein n=1 Tax=Schistocephalus solidus TaxID=70667 RepID=A0A0X3PCK1_SCHSO